MKTQFLHFFALCFATGLMAQYNVTFNVNISEASGFNPDSTEIYITGDFLNWPQPGTDPLALLTMTADPDVYTFTHTFPEGENTVVYKYFMVYNDEPTWDYGEWTGQPDRHEVFIEETTLDNVWGNQPKSVHFMLDVSGLIFDPDTTDFYVTGTFADWCMPGTVQYWKMEPQDEITYELLRYLYSGEHQYKYFMVNQGIPGWDHGEWPGDPNRIINVVEDMVVQDVWGLITGVENHEKDLDVKLFPNPCTSYIRVSLQKSDLPVKRIGIYDGSGALVLLAENPTDREQIFNTGSLRPGTFILVVETNRGSKATKFIKR